MTVHYSDDVIRLHHGDALEVAQTLESGSVRTIVTSPPYFGLRDYGPADQIGTEPTVAAYTARLVALFRELRRVLTDDGTLWLNLGDSYANKNLLGVPWRVAFALQDDGWILRSDIVWSKTNAMPESVTDRPIKAHEYVFMFAKSRKYLYDIDAIRVPHAAVTIARASRARITPKDAPGQTTQRRHETVPNALGANINSVWSVATVPFKGAHSAVYPPSLIRPCIRAGSSAGDTVLDPFSGSGTTGAVAVSEGRKYIGIDLNVEYLNLSLRTRFQTPSMAWPTEVAS